MVNMENVEENVTISQLHGLIKQKRNAELKSILLPGVPSSLINKQESTLMHAAVMFNNIDVIALLFSLGFNINARNSIGQTPLLLAARNNSYQVVQLLLALDADVLVVDNNGTNALQVLLQVENNTPTHIIGTLFERLQRRELSSNEIVDELVKAGCPLEHTFMFNDAEVTREMLVRTNEKDENTLRALLKCAMYTMDMVNARVLLEYKPHLEARRQYFFDEVTGNIFDPATKPFFKQLIHWNTINKGRMLDINILFGAAVVGEYYDDVDRRLDKDEIQMFLDIGIDKYCREKFGFELLVSLFAGGHWFDPLELIKNRQFDVNGRDADGNTALHVVTQQEDISTMRYLLDNGADVNIENANGETPLSLSAETPEAGEFLLDAGADPQVVGKWSVSAFQDFGLANFMSARLMILEFQGLLNDKVRTLIYEIDASGVANKELQKYYDEYLQDLDWMKTRVVSESINLFTVLTEKFERLARYVKDENTCKEIRNVSRERRINRKYSKMLRKNLNKACEMNELKRKAATFLCDKMQIADCDHLVIEKIIGFLTYRNLLVFEEIEEV